MIAWLDILLNACWCGVGAFGFAALFNTPSRALFSIWCSGFVAGFIKFLMIDPELGGGPILASLMAASAVGLASIPIAHWRHVPPVTITIPSVIPLVPGFFAYRTMLGLMKFITHTEVDVLTKMTYNGAMTLFITLSIALGVTLPMLLFRIESVKNFGIKMLFGKWKENRS
jgi:uncharacterized membrane protein YjjB (DUF3815 family)